MCKWLKKSKRCFDNGSCFIGVLARLFKARSGSSDGLHYEEGGGAGTGTNPAADETAISNTLAEVNLYTPGSLLSFDPDLSLLLHPIVIHFPHNFEAQERLYRS